MNRDFVLVVITAVALATGSNALQAKLEPGPTDGRPRVIVTSDGEIDDQCSMVRFLLCANEWDIEAIISSSSQYHAHGHRWGGDDWIQPYLDAYAKLYPNQARTMVLITIPAAIESSCRARPRAISVGR